MRIFADTQLQAKLLKDMQDLYLKRSELEAHIKNIDAVSSRRIEKAALLDIHAYTDFICAAKNLEDTYGSYHWACTSRLPKIVARRAVSASRL